MNEPTTMTACRPNTARWLVTGACGRLGSHVLAELNRRGAHCLGISRQSDHGEHGPLTRLDLEDEAGLMALLQAMEPTHIIHLAAVSSPSIAARDVNLAWRLNVVVTARLVNYAAQRGIHLVFASSDFVWAGDFDGRYPEMHPPAGRAVYARFKILAERLVLRRDAGAVIRYSLMYGSSRCPYSKCDTQLRTLQAGVPVSVVDDEFRTPLSFSDAALATLRLAEAQFRGIAHVAGPEILSPRDLMLRWGSALAIEPQLVSISRMALDPLVCRPRNMAMATNVLDTLFPDVRPRAATEEHLRQVIVPS